MSSRELRYFEPMLTARLSFATVLIPLCLAAQPPNPPRLVRASGEATIKVKPDHAEIQVGVQSDSPTAQGAAQANARQTTAVIEALKSAVGKAGELKTTGYSIAPQYQYGTNNMPPKLTGYRASNTVLVELDDIGSVGAVIDRAVKAGSNDVNGISFSLRDEQPTREQAIAQATVKARANAEAIAKALGVQVRGVFEAETASASVTPIRPMQMTSRMMSAQAVTTPVEAGSLNVQASVTVVLIIE